MKMNVGRSAALMKPSEYCSVGFSKWNVLPTVLWLCVLQVGSHEMKHLGSYERGVMVAERRT